MKAAPKTPKVRRQEEQANFISWRFALLCGCILLALAFLLGRVAWLQVISPDMLVRQGDMRSLRVQEVSTARGMITDRSGRPLAVSVPVKAIWADPKELHDAGGVTLDTRWKALADALNMPLDQLATRINTNPRMRFIYLARQVNPDMADYIKKLKLPGIHLREESRRYYPSGEVTAHLIGFTNVDSQGIEGVEKSFDKWLTGQPGERIVRKDRYGRVIEDISSTDSQAAHNLALSIDERLQALVYRELNNAVAFNKAESGSAVLVDVNTGEVLAMANSPSYNPNNFAGTAKDTMRNRAITDVFEPGSTVKPFVILEGLRRHIISSSTLLDTRPFRVDGHLIRDVGYWPALTPTGILQKSSDTGVSHIALAMPSDALVKTYSSFGLGKPTGLGLPGESTGYFPFSRHRWADIERATFAFGYGLRVTPLQLARAYATLGACGVYHPLSVTRLSAPVYGEQVADPKLADAVIRMMESDVLPGGSGVRAAVPGYRLAIKTGTAEKLGAGGKYDGGHITYTAGVAPASRPEVALVVVINNPKAGQHFGGSVAAPVFGQIIGPVLTRLKIAPDALRAPVVHRQSG